MKESLKWWPFLLASIFYLTMVGWHWYGGLTVQHTESPIKYNDRIYSDMSRQIADKGLDKVYQAGELLESPSLVWTLFVGFIFQFNQEPFIPLLLNLGLAIGFFAFIHRYSELSPVYSFLLLIFLVSIIPLAGLINRRIQDHRTMGIRPVSLFCYALANQ